MWTPSPLHVCKSSSVWTLCTHNSRLSITFHDTDVKIGNRTLHFEMAQEKDLFTEPQIECSHESVCCSNSHIAKSPTSISTPSLFSPKTHGISINQQLVHNINWGPRSLNQILWEWSPNIWKVQSPSDDCDGHQRLRTTNSKQRFLKLGWT